MKRLLVTVCFCFIAFGVFAQKLEDVQQSLSIGAYNQAKEQIDRFLANAANQNNTQAWYYKGKIYAQLYKSDTVNAITYDASGEAFAAFKKYEQMDKKNIMMTLDQHIGYFQLYDANYNRGIKAYTAQNYTEAYNKLKAALEVEAYVRSRGYAFNGFSFPQLDTQLVNLTASSAYLVNKVDEAVPYYKILVDAGINSADYKEVYAMLGQYYQKQNDQLNATIYFEKGKSLFPDTDYWIVYEFGDPGTEYTARFKRYEEMQKKYPDHYPLAIDYASELFNYTYSYTTKPVDYASRQQRFETAIRRALSLKSTAMANSVMSQHIYNQLYDLDEELQAVKATTPVDAAKQQDIVARQEAKYEELNTYSQAAFDLYAAQPTLKNNDKAGYKKVTSQLIEYYERKKDAGKVAFYKEQLSKQ